MQVGVGSIKSLAPQATPMSMSSILEVRRPSCSSHSCSALQRSNAAERMHSYIPQLSWHGYHHLLTLVWVVKLFGGRPLLWSVKALQFRVTLALSYMGFAHPATGCPEISQLCRSWLRRPGRRPRRRSASCWLR